ncbi:hypothetical protein F503_02565 [Ophiostoma piceae UAMH 11346]|uniref:Uncharacterized protein n=1 Tax=Ophiostoma piceae (strain UAMH 11346) TaxID=1262450 RepID=S3C119_OPHP1|nr:hypothetical protein F503_02565 [Ophiostoma piceae UAMH 11346]
MPPAALTSSQRLLVSRFMRATGASERSAIKTRTRRGKRKRKRNEEKGEVMEEEKQRRKDAKTAEGQKEEDHEPDRRLADPPLTAADRDKTASA